MIQPGKLQQITLRVADFTRRLREQILAAMQSPGDGSDLGHLQATLQLALSRDLDAQQFADTYAQTISCGLMTLCFADSSLRTDGVRKWLLSHATPLFRAALGDCFWADQLPSDRNGTSSYRRILAGLANDLATDSTIANLREDDPNSAALYFYEWFLQQYDAPLRSRRGVYYTPQPLVAFIVRGVDDLLRDEFHLADGLADVASWDEVRSRHSASTNGRGETLAEPFVRILDPAMGSGAFLVEVIDRIHRVLTAKWHCAGHLPQRIRQLWNDYVPRHLLPRLLGFELMLPACVVAQLRIAAKLAETGFDFAAAAPLNIYLVNTLAGPQSAPQVNATGDREHRPGWADDRPCTVIVGNPPFSGISKNQGRWIDRLLKGQIAGGATTGSYYRADGQPLGEKKSWLQDDYVKFIRYAQWHIESAGCGIVGLVTNHGYLDNVTFRGMRQDLMRAFPRITVVDLHGNRKKKEVAPGGDKDQNVFQIDQGVAVGLFRRPMGNAASSRVMHADLWGCREEKLQRLSEPLQLSPLATDGPFYFFVPRKGNTGDEYHRGDRLTDIMPVNTTAAVTARDGFVVAFDRQELIERLQAFRDMEIADDEIRRRYFTNGRSEKYPPGDTRGWKLTEARQRMAADEGWQGRIQTCLYRPFDRRPIFWAPWMIDWPRDDVMRHVLAGPNLALIARRQMLPSQACNYFWVSNNPVLDGVIRSDNRGSESLFPLYLETPRTLFDDPGPPRRTANFSAKFIESAGQRLSARWVADGRGDLSESFGPEDLLHYIYALFHSPTYRTRYADYLRTDFPRVFLPRNRRLFHSLSIAGEALLGAHLLEFPNRPANESTAAARYHGCVESVVEPSYPKHVQGRVYVNADAWFSGVTSAVWNFHAGGHQVCRKWLKDRRHRKLTPAEVACYEQILTAIELTMAQMTEIDLAIAQHGGWPAAFHSTK